MRRAFCVILRSGLTGVAWSAIAFSQAASTAPATRAAGLNVPITLSRSGQRVFVAIGDKDRAREVVLWAFGRKWSEPASAKTVRDPGLTGAVVDVPSVRVPTVFSIAPPDQPEDVVAEIVAYPDHAVEWDKNIVLLACGAPAWFNEWSAAVGLPVKQIARYGAGLARPARGDENRRSLLIVGRAESGDDLAKAAKLAEDNKVNVLVLDAEWFGTAGGPVNVAPAQLLGGLAEMARQHWPGPMKFSARRQPWKGIGNRRAWIVDEEGLPLVEEIAASSDPQEGSRCVLASYVPWAEQLGRDESADVVLRELLIQAASASAKNLSRNNVEMSFVRPRQEALERKTRPVLWAAANTPAALRDRDQSRTVWIVDLRGGIDEYLPDTLRHDEKHIGAGADSLLILGDNKKLDEWDWLKMDRAINTIHHPGVIWMRDGELPPSANSQIKLMLKLTELGVPLELPVFEEKKK